MGRRYQRCLVPVSSLAIALASQPANAHLVSTRFGEFYSGLLHPLTTLTHVVPWIALALLAGAHGKSSARRNLWVFPLSVAAGVLIGAGSPGLAPLLTAVNVSSIAVLGLLLALSRPLPQPLLLLLAVACGLSHGHANAAAGLDAWSLALYTTGVGCAAYLLATLLGAAAAALQRHGWGAVSLRAVGSWIFASGILYGSYTLIGSGGV